ncbi:hypothetical protein CSUI_009295, partial [Cystoisospora suis]
ASAGLSSAQAADPVRRESASVSPYTRDSSRLVSYRASNATIRAAHHFVHVGCERNCSLVNLLHSGAATLLASHLSSRTPTHSTAADGPPHPDALFCAET